MSTKPMTTTILRYALLATALSLTACASAPPAGNQQTQTLSTLGFSKVDDGWKLVLPDRVSFEFDKVELKPELKDSIANVARQLLAVDIRQVRVEGYTDNVGARDYNLDLSRRRADIVAAVLVKEGFSAENVESKGYGSDRSIGDNATEAGRAENRRVEIIVLSAMLAPP